MIPRFEITTASIFNRAFDTLYGFLSAQAEPYIYFKAFMRLSVYFPDVLLHVYYFISIDVEFA